MYQLLKPFLFKQDPESIHYKAMHWLCKAYKNPIGKALLKANFSVKTNGKTPIELFGLSFPHPVGLAAGFDKNAMWIDELSTLGFAFIEIGTLTPKAQEGNAKPRLFRIVQDKAIINRMGFNNEGVDAAVRRLKQRKSPVIVGGNIGKNKVTANEDAVKDYEYNFKVLYEVVDYFVVNVSSPNTPGLRDLQEKEPLIALLSHLQNLNQQKGGKPILLKIAPDLTDHQLDDIIEIVQTTQIAGVIATNTTIERQPLTIDTAAVESIGAGGLSGAPLRNRSTAVVKYLHTKSNGAFPIIASGGIFTAEDAQEKLEAGAKLVQVYSGFIYEGPGIVRKIVSKLNW
jgi:dihydroorotate dehydrogenase